MKEDNQMKPELYYPVKPHGINQAFGANANAFYRQDGLKGHPGMDLKASTGQPIYASNDGVCIPQIDVHGGNGVVIIGEYLEGAVRKQYKTIFWHMLDSDSVVHNGQQVKAGELIGYADNTGRSTGPHLHFGLCFFPQDNNNGYGGFTDPQPYFNGKYAEDINHPPEPEPEFQFTRDNKYGSWNREVKEMQTIFNKLGLYPGLIDGDFGPITLVSTKAFQTQHGLKPDGEVGELTRIELNKII